ncbi:IS66 family insertion sequence element accessory protein TnpB [Sorangium sp. So ce1036]
MLTLPPSVRVYVAAEPADLRKSFDGLSSLVAQRFGADPLCGYLFVFRDRRGDQIRILFWDRTGYAIFAKNSPVAVSKERVLGSYYLRADDTGMRVLDQDHPAGVKRGHIWGFVGAELVSFVYAPGWRAKHPAALLQGFTGYLQGDGYAGDGAMLRGDDEGEAIVPEERRLGCGMHIRAKFEKAAKGGDARAAVALAYLKATYRIEAACKAEALSPEARLARRHELSIPVVDKLYEWTQELHLRPVPNTPLHIDHALALTPKPS